MGVMYLDAVADVQLVLFFFRSRVAYRRRGMKVPYTINTPRAGFRMFFAVFFSADCYVHFNSVARNAVMCTVKREFAC